ncbi:V-type ATP synthase subunit E [Enterococcus larvae]|uniref:V-type ATP synthase subunit E n=1 Tax=Enterococcus larvae TaxID=2794352 RepID=UPI003F34746D
MDAIEKIVEQILEKGKDEIATYKSAEKERIEKNFDEQVAAIEIQEKHQIDKNTELAKKAFKQKQNRQQLDVRQETLNRKQELLTQLFKETVEKMNEWDTATFQDFAANVLSKLPVTDDVQLKIGEYSQEKVSQEWLKQFNTDTLSFQLSDAVVSKESGFVIVKDGIEYNFLFSTLVQEIQKAESFKIAEMLFR